ncbi:type II toxin-antitoxin system PemK/MazF family toxin [Nonomuraea endophytica]|uniref:type II toxin-antitoxin system PemK/MazF family toxin n=1 Tax=Nonomuraea endophytica TaxID=714136 RepID=UPI0037C87465
MSDLIIPLRGRVYEADLGQGRKPWLVVSNNARNKAIDDVIVARITTTRRDLPSWIPLGPNDPLAGFVICDDLSPMFRDEIQRDMGALSLATTIEVGKGLARALAL